MGKISRRDFIKKSAIAGVGITAFPMIFIPKAEARWEPKTDVHPNISNLRVVGITDPGMTKHLDTIPQTWDAQEQLVNSKVVKENMDKLACRLADTRNPDEAWRAIFVKPPFKSWSDTKIAIKTNCIGWQHTRSAVMAALCHVLKGTLGADPSNIHIYDARHGTSMSGTPFKGLPEGTKIEGYWDGITATTSVPPPWQGKQANCMGPLVFGTVDILINVAMCKGHSQKFGNFTMTMKNHFGTFSPSPAHAPGGGGLDYLLAINKTPEILGKLDSKTGKVLFPRQQLCFIDALWASETGPMNGPTHQPNFLAMGVFSPVVDFSVATQFRGQRMGWPPNMTALQRMLSTFGYNEKDFPNDARILEVV